MPAQRPYSAFALACLLGLAACVAALSYAAICHRPWFADGAFWYFRLVHNLSFVYDWPHHRYSEFLLQLPAVLALRIIGPDAFPAAIRALDFSYTLHPIVSLIGCYLILAKKHRIELMLYPILSFAIARSSTHGFAVGSVTLALSFFWPLFLLALTSQHPSRRELAAIVTLTVGMLFTHEITTLAIGLIFVLSAIRSKQAVLTRILGLALIAKILLAAIAVISATDAFLFFDSLIRPWGNYRLIGAVLLASWIGAIALSSNPRLPEFAGPSVALAGSSVAFVWALVRVYTQGAFAFSLHATYDGRTTAVILACILAGLSATGIGSSGLRRLQRHRMAAVAIALTLLTTTVHEAVLSERWRQGLLTVQTLLKQKSPCFTLSRAQFHTLLEPFNINGWNLPFISILSHKKRSITAVGFVEPSPTHRLDGESDMCKPLLEKKLIKAPYLYLRLRKRSPLDYSALYR